MSKRIYIHKFGKNSTVVATAEGKLYLFEYCRTLLEEGEESAATWTTFSDNLEELVKLKEKETQEYKPMEPNVFSWEKRVFEYPKFKIYKFWQPETKSIAGGWVYKVVDE